MFLLDKAQIANQYNLTLKHKATPVRYFSTASLSAIERKLTFDFVMLSFTHKQDATFYFNN